MRLANLKERLAKAHFLTGVMTLATATAAGQVVMLLATPLLTRLYTPEQFGFLAMFMAIMAVVLVASSLRYELAIPLPRNNGSARILLLVAVLINWVSAFLTFVVVFFFRTDIARLASFPQLSNLLWLLPVGILLGGGYKIFNYWAVRQKRYTEIARTKLLQSVASVITQIAAGVAGLGTFGLILGQLIGQTAGIIRLAAGVRLGAKSSITSLRGIRMRVMLKRYSDFPKYDTPAALVDVLSVQLPNLLLVALFSPAVAGFYVLAERVLSAPMALVGQAVGQVLFGSCREALKTGSLDQLVAKIILALFTIIFIPCVIIFLWAGDVFATVFGEVWRESGNYASWMILGLSFQFVYSPVSTVLMATDGQKVNLLIHVFMLVAKAGAVIAGYYAGSPLLAILGFSAVGVLGYSGAILVVWDRARRYSAINRF
ncbi:MULTISPECIES: oligosaccharide flippase family protein [Gammaproteobacteria]|uniref:oligosaccharide flippase family protein n=1 Tax=Gammaproteobacteria TaxID=1236 RepID=UPI0028993AC0|nr:MULTISPECIES: oligosaccharide flippase family protein [Gammaproteobacteria]